MSKRNLFVFLIVSALVVFVIYATSHRSALVGEGIRHDRPSPDSALSILRDGNARYVKGDRKFARLDRRRVAETALAQEPFATILACSDSRVPVEHVFDAGIGDLFVVRVAGNVCSDHEIASIEYGAEHLQTPVVVVLGHTYCGAVTAVVENAAVRGRFPHLAEHIIPAHEDALALCPRCDDETIIEETVRCNVRRAVQDLLKISEGVRKLSENGTLKIVGAVYDLRTGTVEWLPELPAVTAKLPLQERKQPE